MGNSPPTTRGAVFVPARAQEHALRIELTNGAAITLSGLHALTLGYEPNEVLLLYPAKLVPEKCSHLHLPLFRQALELSRLSRHLWCADPGSNGDARRHGVLNPRVSAVLICMSFAAVDWSEWLDSNQRSRAPEPLRSSGSDRTLVIAGRAMAD